MPYGLCEGSHTEPNGNSIRLGSPAEEKERPIVRLGP